MYAFCTTKLGLTIAQVEQMSLGFIALLADSFVRLETGKGAVYSPTLSRQRLEIFSKYKTKWREILLA